MKSLIFAILATVFMASAAQAGGNATAGCEPGHDRDESFARWYEYCWRLEVRCEGGAAGSAYLDTTGPNDGIFDYEADDKAPEGGCAGGGTFEDAKQLYNKCEFADGSKFEMQAQPAEYKKCTSG